MLKKFQAEYKKCKSVKQGTFKDLGSPPAKYYWHDTVQALDWLEEEVLQYKIDTSDDPIKASKIEDYAQNKQVAAALKAVQHSLKGWKGSIIRPGLPDPDKSPVFGKDNTKKLEAIKNDILKHKKGLPKNAKPDRELQKLEQQVDADIKEINACRSAYKGLQKEWYEPDKLYDTRIKYILKAKPRLSSKQKKYNELAPKLLTKRALLNAKNECDKQLKEINKLCDQAFAESTKKNTKKAIADWLAATKQLQGLQAKVKVYSDIKKKYTKEISRSEGKKVITEYITRIEKLGNVGESQFEKARDKVNKLA